MSKLVFITGGSRGIGSAMVKAFCHAGYLVAFSYFQNSEKAKELCHEFEGSTLAVKMNQSNETSILQALSTIQNHYKKNIDILVNNAAIAQEKPFNTITSNDWEDMLKTNLQGPFLLAQQVIKGMQNQQWGRIINITSIGGQWGGFNQVHYAASKAGLINLTQSLAKIYSADCITTNAIAIGLVATDMTEAELNTESGKNKANAIPIKRLGTTDEISELALFLASEKASYLTGQTLNANGGMYFG